MNNSLATTGLAAILVALLTLPASADGEQVDLQAVDYLYQGPASVSGALPVGAGDGADYDYGPKCGLGGQAICYEGEPCVADGVEGIKYNVFSQGQLVGEVCVTEQEAAAQQQVTPARVLRAFRSLTWPQSDLVIQPPGGKTLVNFETNFYTDNTRPSRQSVTLLNQDVLIEATPTTYTWRFGDGDALDTSIPGAPYPALDVTHDYLSADTFNPSLDTTYTGRYRLNGGAWTDIPETLTVPGAPQGLQSIEARPTLVDY